MFDVLDLFTIARWLLESLDYQRGRSWDYFACDLSVLDLQLYRHLDTFPLLGGLGDFITSFLGRLKYNDTKTLTT